MSDNLKTEFKKTDELLDELDERLTQQAVDIRNAKKKLAKIKKAIGPSNNAQEESDA